MAFQVEFVRLDHAAVNISEIRVTGVETVRRKVEADIRRGWLDDLACD